MPVADAAMPTGTSHVVVRRSAQCPNNGCAIDDVTVAMSTTAPAFVYERCSSGFKKTSTAGSAPDARSATRCPSQRSAITRRSPVGLTVRLCDEERQLRLAFAAQDRKLDFDAANPA